MECANVFIEKHHHRENRRRLMRGMLMIIKIWQMFSSFVTMDAKNDNFLCIHRMTIFRSSHVVKFNIIEFIAQSAVFLILSCTLVQFKEINYKRDL